MSKAGLQFEFGYATFTILLQEENYEKNFDFF